METELVVHIDIRDDDEIHFKNGDDIETICKTVSAAIQYGLYPDSTSPFLQVKVFPFEEEN